MSPIDMKRIRYVTRFKMPFVCQLLLFAVLISVLALMGRRCCFGQMVLWPRVLSGIDNFWTRYALHGLALIIGAFLLFVALGRIPRILFVFEDELRIKRLLYASRRIDPDRIEEVSLRRGPEV